MGQLHASHLIRSGNPGGINSQGSKSTPRLESRSINQSNFDFNVRMHDRMAETELWRIQRLGCLSITQTIRTTPKAALEAILNLPLTTESS